MTRYRGTDHVHPDGAAPAASVAQARAARGRARTVAPEAAR